MCVTPRIAMSVAAILCFTSASSAQFFPVTPGYGQKQSVVVQIRNGPYGTFTLFSSTRNYVPPGYAPLPSWATPIPVYVPVYVPQPSTRPQIVIQNIVGPQAPPELAPGKPVIPNEFDLVPGKAPPRNGKAVAAKAPPIAAANPEPQPRKMPGRVDADRAIESGRLAFGDGKYGRALELFRRAAEIAPNDPSICFLMSQTYFAISKYREAIAAITVGIALRPDWADARYSSGDLYWKDPPLFAEHLKTLRQAAAAYPDDAALVFLLGHQLWFDGKKDDAMLYVQKARDLDKDFTPAMAFRIDRR